jgi:long-chain acyl-CoA synthetase
VPAAPVAGRPPLSEPVDPLATADPVRAFAEAREHGRSVRLRTSGTSGAPRFVVRSTSSWAASFPAVTDLLELSARSRVWVPGPITSTMNLFATVHADDLGARVQPGPDGATHAVLTPAALARAVAQGADLSGVHVLAAGDRLFPHAHDAALAAGSRRVSHYYGAAELSFVAWGSHALDLKPFPGVEVDCRDGVIWARSPYLCEGYDGPDGPLTWRADGFATVGDRGRVEDGYVRVLGRGEDTVVTAGATVLVADVEAALEQATGHRVVVVGLPHDDLGQILCGVVTDASTLPVLRTAARDILDPAQRPRRWATWADLPLTKAGKLDRALVAERVRSAAGRSAASSWLLP